MHNISYHVNKLDDLLVYCNVDHKVQVYKRIENNLRTEGKLQGDALQNAMENLKAQYEAHLKRPENQMNLKKIIEIGSENLHSIRNSPESILVAGKLNTLIFHHEETSLEKHFSFLFPSLEEKAKKLENELKGNYSKGELKVYFETDDLARNFKIAEPVKKTLLKLSAGQIRDYAKNNVFHLSESLELLDSKLKGLLEAFSPEQRKAFFQGIAETPDKEQSFRQLFSSLHNVYLGNAPQLLDSFPREHFIEYFVNNLQNIKKENLSDGTFFGSDKSFFTLNEIIVEGRLNPVVELLVLHALEKNDYLSINNII